jgi:hypothetical protein
MLFACVSAQSDSVLIPETKALLKRESDCIAQVLARLAVIDDRRLFAEVGYPSMYEFCLQELGLSERAALNRLTAARIAFAHPLLFDALADGRISMSTIFQLSHHLRVAPAAELVAGVAHLSRAQAEVWLAKRFERPPLPTKIESVSSDHRRTPLDDGSTMGLFDESHSGEHPPGGVALANSHESSERKEPLPARAQVIPCREERVAYQFTVDRSTHELFLKARDLLGNEVAPGDVANVMAHALRALVHEREKAGHGLHSTTRGPAPTKPKGRYLPARLRAVVFRRDGGRCAFVTDDGKRCECRRALQYDHIVPLAQGGQTSESNLRLLCPAHNQIEADRRLGRAFMDAKRDARKQGNANHSIEGAA